MNGETTGSLLSVRPAASPPSERKTAEGERPSHALSSRTTGTSLPLLLQAKQHDEEL